MAVPHVIGVTATADAPIFELSIPFEVFGRHRRGWPDLGYEVRLCAPPGIRVGGGFAPDPVGGYDHLVTADTVIVCALENSAEPPPGELVAAVKAAHERGARVVSLCSGAFVLAAAGLLDGRPATTHWLYAAELARRHPAVLLDPTVLYVDDGEVLTSAGTTAGLDLCLHILALDHGAAVANALARRLVAPAHRGGGQAQYIESPVAVSESDGMAELLDWMRGRLAEPLTLAWLARQTSMAERTLIRRFRAATGTTPLKWLTAQRILAARDLLESGKVPVEQVGHAVGLGGPANFRRHFTASLGVSPGAYRRAFHTAGG